MRQDSDGRTPGDFASAGWITANLRLHRPGTSHASQVIAGAGTGACAVRSFHPEREAETAVAATRGVHGRRAGETSDRGWA